jgi:hypothetical protein
MAPNERTKLFATNEPASGVGFCLNNVQPKRFFKGVAAPTREMATRGFSGA